MHAHRRSVVTTLVLGLTAVVLGCMFPGQVSADDRNAPPLPLGAGPLRVQVQHKSIVTHLAWSPDGKRVATGTEDGTIHIVDLASGKDVQSFAAGKDAGEFALSPDGKKLGVLEGGQAVVVWDVNAGNLEHKRGG